MNRPPGRSCLNCGASLLGGYCHACGQRDQEVRVPLRQLLGDLFENVLQWDSRLLRTLRFLALRPGFLTNEYLAGRRVRYLPPLRLFLLSSVLFILAMIVGENALVLQTSGDATEASAAGGVAQLTVTGAPEGTGMVGAALTRGLQRMQEDPDRARELWSRAWTWMAFLMMPVFALLLSLAFRGRGRVYTEHLVFSVHLHSFAFGATAAAVILSHLGGPSVARFGSLVLLAALAAYLLVSLRTVYGRGWAGTALTAFGLMTAHLVVVVVCAGGAVLATVFLAA